MTGVRTGCPVTFTRGPFRNLVAELFLPVVPLVRDVGLGDPETLCAVGPNFSVAPGGAGALCEVLFPANTTATTTKSKIRTHQEFTYKGLTVTIFSATSGH